jgi:hypothetical protein
LEFIAAAAIDKYLIRMQLIRIIVDYIIKSRSLFVLSLEIADRDEVKVATGRSTKRPSTSFYYEFGDGQYVTLKLSKIKKHYKCILKFKRWL